jgi:hypothetical protein
MVGEAVEESGGHLGISEDRRPLTEAEISGDDDAGLLVEAERLPFIVVTLLAATSNGGGS